MQLPDEWSETSCFKAEQEIQWDIQVGWNAKIHRRLRCYSPTPLISLPKLAKNLGVKELLVKDESKRFRINTFKSLGASYAIAKVISQRKKEKLIFCTATDGNHGRSVAWAARNSRQKSVVYVPKYTTSSGLRISKNIVLKSLLWMAIMMRRLLLPGKNPGKKGMYLYRITHGMAILKFDVHCCRIQDYDDRNGNSIHPLRHPGGFRVSPGR